MSLPVHQAAELAVLAMDKVCRTELREKAQAVHAAMDGHHAPLHKMPETVPQAAVFGETRQVLLAFGIGESVRIVNVVRGLDQVGRNWQIDITTVWTGVLYGEKLTEALLADADATIKTLI